MPDTVQSALADLGLLALPLVTQIFAAVTACYTAYRALCHGLPVVWRAARTGWSAAAAWARLPSKAAQRRTAERAVQAKMLSVLDRIATQTNALAAELAPTPKTNPVGQTIVPGAGHDLLG